MSTSVARPRDISRSQVLESLEAFFTRFQVLKATQGQALEAIESLLQRFGAALPGLEEKRRSWESENAPRFNIFRILRIQRREVKLHSRFLAELLDPLGSHSQREYPEQNLIFLTPDGRPPDTISTDMCVCLSYCEHIETWLKRAVTKIEAPWLRFAIEQYLQIVQSF